MRKLPLLCLCLLIAVCAQAQWRVAPLIGIGYNDHSYDAPFPPDDSTGTTYMFGVELQKGATDADDHPLGFVAGASLLYTHISSDGSHRSFTHLPIYALVRLNIGFVFDAGVGYDIPLGSVGRGYATGLSLHFGAGIQIEKIYLGIRGEWTGIGKPRELWYVPDGWVPTSHNYDFCFILQYAIPFKK